MHVFFKILVTRKIKPVCLGHVALTTENDVFILSVIV